MIQLLQGDAREVLATLPDASVHMVVTSPPYYGLRAYLPEGHADKHREMGSEPTPDAYIAAMVQVFRELRRVLRDDGTCWVNMGDGFRDKQLLMMPARLALALQADGWFIRSAITWCKPNPMPESARDRCTSATEMVYLLTKKPRYFIDMDAIRENRTSDEDAAIFRGGSYVAGEPGPRQVVGNRRVKVPGGWDRGDGAHGTIHRDGRTSAEYQDAAVSSGRNARNWWVIATAPYPAAHFATFPPELAERCIRAGTSARGACSKCGAPWVRQVEKAFRITRSGNGKAGSGHALDPSSRWAGWDNGVKDTTTTGWAPGCACPMAWPSVPCVVLDPFSGAGTTALVADRLGRDAIGIDLSHQYVEMTRERITADAGLFADLAPVPEHPVETEMADLFADDDYQRLPAAVPDVPRNAFRNSERYVNQGSHPSNGLPEAAE